MHFNLPLNHKDGEAPFAFLATYTNRLSAYGKAQHLPLGQALREYAGAGLLSFLLPVQRADAGERRRPNLLVAPASLLAAGFRIFADDLRDRWTRCSAG